MILNAITRYVLWIVPCNLQQEQTIRRRFGTTSRDLSYPTILVLSSEKQFMWTVYLGIRSETTRVIIAECACIRRSSPACWTCDLCQMANNPILPGRSRQELTVRNPNNETTS